jgi:hypothetical protein
MDYTVCQSGQYEAAVILYMAYSITYFWHAKSRRTENVISLDVDSLADMRLEHIPALVAALSKEFYADDEMMKEAIHHRKSRSLRPILRKAFTLSARRILFSPNWNGIAWAVKSLIASGAIFSGC